MDKTIELTWHQKAVLNSLRKADHQRRAGDPPKTLSAVEIAKDANIAQELPHETQRRQVRKIIKELRDLGAAIGTDGTGYYLATEAADIKAHQDFLLRTGIRQISSAAKVKRSEAADQATSQGRLF